MDKEPVSTEVKPIPRDFTKVGGRYANYVLVVLVLVYVFNLIDRQILSILAEEIKADLGLTDASIGFLYGTAFAVFYAIFGIPLARLADIGVRKNLIAIGLFFWSLMTALSGTTRSFFSLGACRIGVGVGIGESSASPAAFSLLSDYFPPRLRATAVAIYSSGVYIGTGLGIVLGGWIVDGWNAMFPDGDAPFGLAAWQAAFFAVGLPGLLMALWVRTLREPVRGQSEGIPSVQSHPNPFRELGHELIAVLPPLTLISLARAGAGVRGLSLNVAVGVACASGAWVLISTLGSPAQWVALTIGLYSFFSWIHGLTLRDREAFDMIYRSRAIVFGVVGFGWCAFVGYSLNFWVPPFFQRVHGIRRRTLRRPLPIHIQSLRCLLLQLSLSYLLFALDRLCDSPGQRAGPAAHARHFFSLLHPDGDVHRAGPRAVRYGSDQRHPGPGRQLQRGCFALRSPDMTACIRCCGLFPLPGQPLCRGG